MQDVIPVGEADADDVFLDIVELTNGVEALFDMRNYDGVRIYLFRQRRDPSLYLYSECVSKAAERVKNDTCGFTSPHPQEPIDVLTAMKTSAGKSMEEETLYRVPHQPLLKDVALTGSKQAALL